MAFNFLTGQSIGNPQAPQMGKGGQTGMQSPQATQLYQMLQQARQSVPGANVGQWAQSPQLASQTPMAMPAGIQTQPSYAQNPLSNQGANGFSLGDYLAQAQSSGMNINQALGGLQSMLKAWGSHS